MPELYCLLYGDHPRRVFHITLPSSSDSSQTLLDVRDQILAVAPLPRNTPAANLRLFRIDEPDVSLNDERLVAVAATPEADRRDVNDVFSVTEAEDLFLSVWDWLDAERCQGRPRLDLFVGLEVPQVEGNGDRRSVIGTGTGGEVRLQIESPPSYELAVQEGIVDASAQEDTTTPAPNVQSGQPPAQRISENASLPERESATPVTAVPTPNGPSQENHEREPFVAAALNIQSLANAPTPISTSDTSLLKTHAGPSAADAHTGPKDGNASSSYPIDVKHKMSDDEEVYGHEVYQQPHGLGASHSGVYYSGPDDMNIKITSNVMYPHTTPYSSSQYLASGDETATSPPAPPPPPVKYGAGDTEGAYGPIIDGPLETYIEVRPTRKPSWIKICIACFIGIGTSLAIVFIVRSITNRNGSGGDLDIGSVPSDTNYLRKFYVGAKAKVKRVILSPDHSNLFAYTADPNVPIQQFSLTGPENAVRSYPTPDKKASMHGFGRETAIGLGDQGQSLYRSHDIEQYPAVEGHLLKYNSATGDLIWNATVPDSIQGVFPGGGRGLDDPNTVLVMTPQVLYQLDAQTGAYRASVRFPAARDTTYSAPAIVTPDSKSAWIVDAVNSYVMVKYDISIMTPGPIMDVKPAGKTAPLKYMSISAVGVAPDSQHVFLGTSRDAVVKFPATSPESEYPARGTYGMNGYMHGVAVHPCNCLLAGVSEGSAVLWDIRRSRVLLKLDTGTQLELSSVDFSADGKVLAMGDEQGWIWVWELQGGWYA
ncbi:hypothetical protein HDU85_003703 [Gaertneriomyces sp. JEL0708]|nr:hypothetical protein HDU85_003703 [Gaertneriomyces sp. JEL0708]